MKLSVVVGVFIALASGNAIPLVPRDNSHYVEGESRYIWMSQDDGELVLVDLHEVIDDDNRNTKSSTNHYWLFTRENPNTYQLLVDGDINSIRNSNYKADRPTVVIAHGWTNSGSHSVNVLVGDAFLAVQDCNIIVVDWSGVAGLNYVRAVNGVPTVGEALGYFLDWLLYSAGGDWNQVHLIGYSLGAQVVGNAGRTLEGKPARVTGLDPAGPLWLLNPFRLTSAAGQYVEGIHTDGGIQGVFLPVGDADFYPNGGRHPQTGCNTIGCSHSRAYQFMASSIMTNHLVGRRCGSLLQAQIQRCNGDTFNMGGADMNKRGNGIFGLVTGSTWPF